MVNDEVACCLFDTLDMKMRTTVRLAEDTVQGLLYCVDAVESSSFKKFLET